MVEINEYIPDITKQGLDFSDFKREIEIAQTILLESNYSLEIFDKATRFLYDLVNEFYNRYHEKLDVPSIQPGIEGDVDLAWNNERFEILLSISGNPSEKSGLFGNSKKYSDSIKLEFEYDEIKEDLLKWLAKHY